MTTTRKTVSFVVHYPYQWFIYRPIWRHIDWADCEVIVDLRPVAVPQAVTVRADIERMLLDEGVSYRILEPVDYFDQKKLTEFFADVEVLVSCWERGCMSIPETAHIKKVNTTYGIAKELTLVRPSRSICDLILAYGPRDQAYFALLTRSVAVGNPRFDDFYNGTHQIPSSCMHLDRTKPVLLYAPGHGDLGSLAKLFEVFRDEIVKHFTVLLKPHYFTLRDEADLVGTYATLPNVTVINDATDLIGVIAAADVVLTDTSSLIFDALQAHKPLVVTDFLSTEYLNVYHKVLRVHPRGLSGASTYGDSLEQVCKREGKLRTITSPEELLPTLQNYETWHATLRPVQETLVRELFAFTDGTSGRRAAEEIRALFLNARDHRPGILAHAYLAYKNRFSQLFLSSQATTTETTLTQVVVVDDVRASAEDRAATLASARGVADRVLFLSRTSGTSGAGEVTSTIAGVKDWINKAQNVLFVGVGVLLPKFRPAWIPNEYNRICFFAGGDATQPLSQIRQSILGIRPSAGLSVTATSVVVSKPNHVCTDIQALLLSGQFFYDYYQDTAWSDFGHFPLSVYQQYAPMATFEFFPYALNRIRTDEAYGQQQMLRYGLFARSFGLQVWDCEDLRTRRLLQLLFVDRKTLRLEVIKMNAMLRG